MSEMFISANIISYEESAALIDESTIENSLDLGHSIVYRLSHPKHGQLFVVSSAVGSSGAMIC